MDYIYRKYNTTCTCGHRAYHVYWMWFCAWACAGRGVVADVGHFVRGHFGNRVFGTPWDPSSIIAGTSSSVFPLPRFLHPPVQSLPRPLCWGEGCGQVGGEERDGGELPSPPPPGPRATTLLPGNSSAARRGVPTWPRQLRRGWGAVSRGGGEGCG